MHRQKTGSGALCLGFVLFGLLPAVDGGEIRTGPVDKARFRALVDGAAAGDTIACEGGAYDFTEGEGIAIVKPLRIVAADPNNPPVFAGRTASSGKPAIVPGNDAFFVVGLEEDLEGLAFIGLHFTSFNHALIFDPQLVLGNDCNPTAPGVLSQLRIERCRVTNTRRAVQIDGGNLQNFRVVDNSFSSYGDLGTSGIRLFAGAAFEGAARCGEALDVGRPRDGIIAGNHFEGNHFGITTIGVESLFIHDNVIDGSRFGILLGDQKALDLPDDGPINLGAVQGNIIHGGVIGLIGQGPTSLRRASFSGNTILGASFGILMELAANDFLLANNDFGDGSLEVDVFLDGASESSGPTHDNKVVATDSHTTVLDLGEGNRLVGRLASASNQGVAQHVREELRESRAALAVR